MSAQLGLVCECVQGTPLFFFSFVDEKTQQPISNCCCERKKKREREREREEKSNREESLSRLSQLSPLCFVSAVVLKSNKAL